MEKILEQIENSINIELTTEQENKIVGQPYAGAVVSIKWKGMRSYDCGYLLRLPIQDDDDEMLDFIVHATKVNNDEGIGEGDEQWVHLKELLTFNNVKSITFS